MKIVRNLITKKKVTLEEFATKHNLVMQINEREQYPPGMRLAAFFQNTKLKTVNGEVKDICGNGDREANAIRDYAKMITKATLIYEDGTVRKTIEVPDLILWPRKEHRSD